MTDMHELGSSENFSESTLFDVGTNEPTHPIIGDNNRWEDLKLAESLK